MATIAMAAYTNYARDPRVKREGEALVDAGHHVVFYARQQPGEPRRETIAGVDVVRLWTLPGKRNGFAAYMFDYLVFFVLLTVQLTRNVRRFDLIHINNMPDFLVFAAWLPRLLGKPVIHDIHDLMPEIYMEKFRADERHWAIRILRLQERLAGQFATAVLTVEERLRTILSGRGIPEDKIRVLINLPDERIFAPRLSPPKKDAAAPFVLVYHGTLARRLGLDVALRAVALLTKNGDRPPFPKKPHPPDAALEDRKWGSVPIFLRIIGAGEERDALIALRDELGLGEMVHFSDGFVPVEQIPALLADADVGIIPLRISSATDIMLPTKLLEYAQMGIPCIVARTATIARYFDDRMVCFFEAEDAASLAGAIRELWEDSPRRESLAQSASSRFGAHYRWSEHKKIYVGLVDSLLRSSGSASRPAFAHPSPIERVVQKSVADENEL